ncbi:hypothetical protein [Deinococcus geothermalis]|uniref:hypothetical protein n=1 Tax=Deinococcus geothermalis TaxID=68909 RepID=UPI0002FD2808|nr:hypothetical protein [Deinococcus geothermalis]
MKTIVVVKERASNRIVQEIHGSGADVNAQYEAARRKYPYPTYSVEKFTTTDMNDTGAKVSAGWDTDGFRERAAVAR